MEQITIEKPLLKEQVFQNLQIHSTNNYDLFSFLSGNRPVNPAHAKRLERAILKRYLFTIIIVNEFFQVIDGQHRYTVLKKLGLPVYYVIIPGYGINEVQLFNTNSSNWRKVDYLHTYCELGYPVYLQFRDFMEEFAEFKFQSAEMILSQKTINRTSFTSKELVTETNTKGAVHFRTFEDGDFVIPDIDWSRDCATKILQLKPYYIGFNRKSFIATMIQLLRNDNYDHNEFIAKLSWQPTALVDCTKVTHYRALIEEIYNYKRRSKVNLRF